MRGSGRVIETPLPARGVARSSVSVSERSVYRSVDHSSVILSLSTLFVCLDDLAVVSKWNSITAGAVGEFHRKPHTFCAFATIVACAMARDYCHCHCVL